MIEVPEPDYRRPKIDRAAPRDEMLMDARLSDILKMVVPGVGRHSLDPVLRVFVNAERVADVEIQPQPR